MDANSTGGLIDGEALKGDWISVDFVPKDSQSLSELYYADITYKLTNSNK